MQDGPDATTIAGRIAAMHPLEETGFHVAFDTMAARRSASEPDRIEAHGYLLLDNGRYALVTAIVPLDVFWQMKAMDILAVTRHHNRRRAQSEGHPAAPTTNADAYVGSVWLIDGELAHHQAGAPRARKPRTVRTIRVSRLHALDRVALERRGPRLVESFGVSDMLPAPEPDA